MTFDSTSSDDVLAYGMNVLKRIYKMAKKKEDITLMMGVADRLLMLYESMADTERQKKQAPMGFMRMMSEEASD